MPVAWKISASGTVDPDGDACIEGFLFVDLVEGMLRYALCFTAFLIPGAAFSQEVPLDVKKSQNLFYADIGGGLSLASDTDLWFDDAVGGQHVNGNYNGGIFRGALGLSLPYGFRTELEVAHRSNKTKDSAASDGWTYDEDEIEGKINATSVMANLFYDFSLTESFSVFAGAGAGYARVKIDTEYSGFDFVQARGSADRFAYQLMAGTEFKVSERVGLNLRYTYFDTTSDKMTFENTGMGTVDGRVSYSNHSLTAGIRVGF